MPTELLPNPVSTAADAAEWETKTDLIRRTVAQGASADELDTFFYTARRAGLDPLAKQIYYVKRKGRGVIQVGIDGLRLIADRTGVYAGSDDAEFAGTTDGGHPAKAKVTVYKIVSGIRCPFSATARWDEYYPGDDQGFMWRKMPHTMLSKCAEALALRKAFPADMSGLYIHEEMDQAGKSATEPAREAEPVREEETPLEGPALLRATLEKFGDVIQPPKALTKAVVAPDGAVAYGYAPVRWPLQRMFDEPMTDNQRKMQAAKERERALDPDVAPEIRRRVLEAYGVVQTESKAAACLYIDWLLHAEESGVDEAAGR